MSIHIKSMTEMLVTALEASTEVPQVELVTERLL